MRLPSWLLRGITHFHRVLHRITGGRLFHRVFGLEFCFLTMRGAKSGKERTVPLLSIPHGEAVLVVASSGGSASHPAWFHNLVAHPEIWLERRGERTRARARVLDFEEKSAVWPLCLSYWRFYEEYERRSARDIPVVLLEPFAPEGGS